jgi:hypothetical protein
VGLGGPATCQGEGERTFSVDQMTRCSTHRVKSQPSSNPTRAGCDLTGAER